MGDVKGWGAQLEPPSLRGELLQQAGAPGCLQVTLRHLETVLGTESSLHHWGKTF